VIDLNKTDADQVHPAMTRPQVIDTFMEESNQPPPLGAE